MATLGHVAFLSGCPVVRKVFFTFLFTALLLNVILLALSMHYYVLFTARLVSNIN